MRRQKQLDVDPKEIQQIELAGQLKNTDGVNAGVSQSMFILAISEMIKNHN